MYPGLGVEKLELSRLVEKALRLETLQTTFLVFLDTFYPPQISVVLGKMEFFNRHALTTIISGLPKITGPNLFEPHFSVSALIIKQFGRLFSA